MKTKTGLVLGLATAAAAQEHFFNAADPHTAKPQPAMDADGRTPVPERPALVSNFFDQDGLGAKATPMGAPQWSEEFFNQAMPNMADMFSPLLGAIKGEKPHGPAMPGMHMQGPVMGGMMAHMFGQPGEQPQMGGYGQDGVEQHNPMMQMLHQAMLGGSGGYGQGAEQQGPPMGGRPGMGGPNMGPGMGGGFGGSGQGGAQQHSPMMGMMGGFGGYGQGAHQQGPAPGVTVTEVEKPAGATVAKLFQNLADALGASDLKHAEQLYLKLQTTLQKQTTTLKEKLVNAKPEQSKALEAKMEKNMAAMEKLKLYREKMAAATDAAPVRPDAAPVRPAAAPVDALFEQLTKTATEFAKAHKQDPAKGEIILARFKEIYGRIETDLGKERVRLEEAKKIGTADARVQAALERLQAGEAKLETMAKRVSNIASPSVVAKADAAKGRAPTGEEVTMARPDVAAEPENHDWRNAFIALASFTVLAGAAVTWNYRKITRTKQTVSFEQGPAASPAPTPVEASAANQETEQV